MNKKLIALLSCVLISLSGMCSVLPAIMGAAEQNAVEPAPLDNSEPIRTSESIFPDSELTYTTYQNHLMAQVDNAMEDPAVYIGYEAGFHPYWDSIWCRAGFSSTDVDVFIPLTTEDDGDSQAINVNNAVVVITDYHFDETNTLWYKVEAAEGYTLPQELADNPYVLHIDAYAYEYDDMASSPPTLFVRPQQAIFLPGTETVTVKNGLDDAADAITVNVADLPAPFDVAPTYSYGNYGQLVWGWYDVGSLIADHPEYRYVAPEDIQLIPVEAAYAYERLMSAEDTYEYYAILSEIPEGVLAQLSDAHKTKLDVCIEELHELEKVVCDTTVTYGDKQVPVSVMGKLPDNVTLSANVVTYDAIVAAGFNVTDESSVVTALDIKLINNDDGTEWQPKEGRQVTVSIGVGALGYADGTILGLQHKHGEDIYSVDLLVVEDGAVTVHSDGFSIYLVSAVNQTTSIGTTINDNGTFELEVGKEVVYYVRPQRNGTIAASTWEIVDPQGAVYYTVHAENTTLRNSGVNVRWLKMNTLKEATGIKLIFHFRINNTAYSETYTLNIVAPKAEAGKRKLYLKDDVNKTGRIVATLVDENGNEIEHGLDGAALSWSRDDDVFIVPAAYGDEYRSVNIARDHAGLVEARRDPETGAFNPTTYTLDVILSDGSTPPPATYTVYYQSEIINSDFERPGKNVNNKPSYIYFPNGWPDLYWKTTAPGSSRGGGYISMDVEYGYPANASDTGWGITQAADAATGGQQFAEINCEAFGALYQDIITAPGEDIEWTFSHAPRQNQSWSGPISNAMYIVIGPTEEAQKMTQDDMLELGRLARTAGNGNRDFENGLAPVEVEYRKDGVTAQYLVWYHDAGTYAQGNYSGQWTELNGSYSVPEGQYRTRLFFVSRPYNDNKNSDSLNAGNLIDQTKAGQYKKYLIEYYEQTYDGTNLVIKRVDDKQEEGEALVYSSVKLENYYSHFVQVEHDYLHHVEINGQNSPYDLRYSTQDPDNAYLYIEKYPGTATDPMGGGKDYSEYDIVMQVYLRDTVVAVQKLLEFPTALSEEQKLELMNYFATLTPAGYESEFRLFSADGSYQYNEVDQTLITQRDPAGNYRAYVALGENPQLGHPFSIEETYNTAIPGLELQTVTFKIQLYESGKQLDEGLIKNEYTETQITAGNPLISDPFTLIGNIKIADVTVVNSYKEKETTIYYKGVGNGKIKLDVTGAVFEDTPSETLPFYSGQSKGCSTHAGAGATFVGWYKDEACTIKVTEKDGVWDTKTGSFKPNANIINADVVYFYAKFETGSITINRENASPEQSFVYHVQSTDGSVDMYVTLACDASGNGSTEILEVPLNKTYKVTECEDWSWRHSGSSSTQSNSDTNRHLDYTFTSGVQDDKKSWLNGYSNVLENIFGKPIP